MEFEVIGSYQGSRSGLLNERAPCFFDGTSLEQDESDELVIQKVPSKST
jgi:hypothetical protein